MHGPINIRFIYFIILIVYTYYILCISWRVKCLIIIDARRKHEDTQILITADFALMETMGPDSTERTVRTAGV